MSDYDIDEHRRQAAAAEAVKAALAALNGAITSAEDEGLRVELVERPARRLSDEDKPARWDVDISKAVRF